MNAQLQPTGSAYFIAKETQLPETHTLSVLVDNEPGVLARIATILSDLGISIDAMRQAESDQVGGEETNQTDLVILTHECQEAHMNQALTAMQALPSVLQPIVRIRKEELN